MTNPLLSMNSVKITVGDSLDTSTPFAQSPSYFSQYIMPVYRARNDIVVQSYASRRTKLDTDYVELHDSIWPNMILTSIYKPTLAAHLTYFSNNQSFYASIADSMSVDKTNYLNSITTLNTLLPTICPGYDNLATNTQMTESNAAMLESLLLSAWVRELQIIMAINNKLTASGNAVNTSYFAEHVVSSGYVLPIIDNHFPLQAGQLDQTYTYNDVYTYCDSFINQAITYMSVVDLFLSRKLPSTSLTTTERNQYLALINSVKSNIQTHLSGLPSNSYYTIGAQSPLVTSTYGYSVKQYKLASATVIQTENDRLPATPSIQDSYFSSKIPRRIYTSPVKATTGGGRVFTQSVTIAQSQFGSGEVVHGVKIAGNKIFLVPTTGISAKIFNVASDTITTAGGTYGATDGYVYGVLMNDGRVFLIPDSSTTAKIYDPTNNTLTDITTWPVGVQMSKGVAMTDGKLYLTATNDLDGVFNPTTNAFTQFTAASIGNHQSCIKLNDGRVLMAEGLEVAQVTVYNPTTGVWTNINVPGLQTYFIDFVKLTDGKVLMMPAFAAGAALFDPVTNTVSRVGPNMPADSDLGYSLGVLLPNGDVLGIRFDPATQPPDASIFNVSNWKMTYLSYVYSSGPFSFATVLDDGRVFMLPMSSPNAPLSTITPTTNFEPVVTIGTDYGTLYKYEFAMKDIITTLYPTGTLTLANKSRIKGYVDEALADYASIYQLSADSLTGASSTQQSELRAARTSLNTAYIALRDYNVSMNWTTGDTQLLPAINTAVEFFCDLQNGEYSPSLGRQCGWVSELQQKLQDLYFGISAVINLIPSALSTPDLVTAPGFTKAYGIKLQSFTYSAQNIPDTIYNAFAFPVASEQSTIESIASHFGITSTPYSSIITNLATYESIKNTIPTGAESLPIGKAIFQSYGKVAFTLNGVTNNWLHAGAVINSSQGPVTIGRTNYIGAPPTYSLYDNSANGTLVSDPTLISKYLNVF